MAVEHPPPSAAYFDQWYADMVESPAKDELVRRHLDAVPRICSGEAAAGPIARLAPSERFHWLVSPRSTIIQVSPVHSGLCDDPPAKLLELFERLVAC